MPSVVFSEDLEDVPIMAQYGTMFVTHIWTDMVISSGFVLELRC